MKQLLFLLILLSSLSSSNVLFAQNNRRGDDQGEKWRAEKVSFITEKLELTPAEAEKLWPVYNELERKRWEAQRSRRELEDRINDAKENLSEREIIQLTKDFTGSMEKEGALQVNYNDEFLKILSPEKVLKLYKAENDFRMYMIMKFRDRSNRDSENEF